MLPDDICTVKEAIMENGFCNAECSTVPRIITHRIIPIITIIVARTGVNHGISIVGWDDSKRLPETLVVHQKHRAWIVKNTWGTNTMDGGYFYVSYEDKYVGTECFLLPKS